LRLQKRVPSALFQDTFTLDGWQLEFHKRGRDGSAKCDIVKSAAAEAKVFGAMYLLDAAEKLHLDKAEGLGKGYDQLDLEHPGYGPFFLYLANPSHIDSSLKPFTWYKNFVYQGALFHQFPQYYLEKISKITAIADHDQARCSENHKILKQLQPLTG
jgi:hypothetical protein